MSEPRRTPGTGGFTLLELIVVLGILVGFLAMLIQFVDSGVRLFDEGEAGQSLADRAEAARSALERELRTITADNRQLEPVVPKDRFVVQQLGLGLPARTQSTDPRAFFLRAGVLLSPQVEERLQHDALMLKAAAELGGKADVATVAARARELRSETGLRGRGRMLLAQWPQTSDQALIELRVGRFLADQELKIGDDKTVDPFAVQVPGGPDLPTLLLYANTELLVGDLLYAEILMWSQQTSSWDGNGADGPEQVWDSARGGWLDDQMLGPVFRFDVGPESANEPADDIHPHALRATLVVAVDPRRPPEGLLAATIEPDARVLQLVNGDRFPGPDTDGWTKIEGEWVHYAERQGDQLRGLQRGQRGTRAREHGAGAVLRVGRTVRFTVPIPHWKDDWNG